MAGRGPGTVTRFAEGATSNQDEYVRREARLAAQAARDPRRVRESVTAAGVDPEAGVPYMRYNAGLTEADREYIALREAAETNADGTAVAGPLGGQLMITDRDWSLRDRFAKNQEVERRDKWIRAYYLGPGSTAERRAAARKLFPDFFEREAKEIERSGEISKLTQYMNLYGVDNTQGLSDEECEKLGRFIYGSAMSTAVTEARRTQRPFPAPQTILATVQSRVRHVIGPFLPWLVDRPAYSRVTGLLSDVLDPDRPVVNAVASKRPYELGL